jgi:adenylyltransferase/sulfurtransferase
MGGLSEQERARYARQLMIPGWGDAAQERLRAATVFIAGAGGLGSPVAVALAQAGVGTLRICDFDSPDLSNLNRQFLHDESRFGMNKAESAKRTLARVNPHVRVEALPEKIDAGSADRLLGDAQLILDCLDNYPTRLVLNALAVRRGIPLVHGSIWGFEGRVTFIQPPETPCLACIFPSAPPAQTFPVVGTTPGVTGMLQATEALKYFVGVGDLLKGRLLCCDFQDMRFLEVRVRKDPRCPACGSR